MSVHGEVEEVADRLGSLAASLRTGSKDPDQVAAKLRSLADDLDDLARKVRRAAKS